MANAPQTGNRLRRRRIALVLAGFVACAAAGALAWPHLMAWSDLQDGRATLESDPVAAREFLDHCLATWPGDSEAHFLAARAARLTGVYREASRHLDEAARLGWSEPEVAAERTCLQSEFDRLASLARGYMAEFRWPEADEVVRQWLEHQPDSSQAWTYRSQILERNRKLAEAAEALRQADRLSPNDRRIRFDLARLILEARQPPEEAASHLEWLVHGEPNNLAVAVQLAICREVQGRVPEAISLLDRTIAEHPNDSKASYIRGRLELNRGNPAAAVGPLRRAAELDPSDQEALYSLVLALNIVGKPDEIRAAEERWRRCDADLKRVAEIGRSIVRAPNDPDLRREMGELFLRNGRDADGLRWLHSVLAKQPNHLPTHRVLARYYEGKNQLELAATHRSFIQTAERSPLKP